MVRLHAVDCADISSISSFHRELVTPHNTLLFLWDHVLLRPNRLHKRPRADRGSGQTDEAGEEGGQEEESEEDERDPDRLEEQDLRLLDEVVAKTESIPPLTSFNTAEVPRNRDQRVSRSSLIGPLKKLTHAISEVGLERLTQSEQSCASVENYVSALVSLWKEQTSTLQNSSPHPRSAHVRVLSDALKKMGEKKRKKNYVDKGLSWYRRMLL